MSSGSDSTPLQPNSSGAAETSNLTQVQSLIWAGQQLAPNVPLYNMAIRYDIFGAIDIQRFQRAFDTFVLQSDAMRTIFQVERRQPQQRIVDHVPAACAHALGVFDKIDRKIFTL